MLITSHSVLEPEKALIVTEFDACRLPLGAQRLLGDLSVTCAAPPITLGCGHVTLCVRDRVQQERIFYPVVSHSSHIAWRHSERQRSNAPSSPCQQTLNFFNSPSTKNINLIHHFTTRKTSCWGNVMMNFHPFPTYWMHKWSRFWEKKGMRQHETIRSVWIF